MRNIYIFTFLVCFCLNMSHAQPVTAPITTPAATAPAALPAAPHSGKFAEYESICRSDDYSGLRFLSDDEKTRRVHLIQDKIKKFPENLTLKTILLREYLGQAENVKAHQLFSNIEKSLPEEIQKSFLVEFEVQKKNYSEALKILEEAIKNIPKSNTLNAQLADLNQKRGLLFESRSLYEDMNKSGTYDIKLCELLMIDSYYKEGELICLRALKNNPKSPLPNVFLGIADREREFFEPAQTQFEKSIKIEKTEFAYSCLGETKWLLKKYDEAVLAFDQALKINEASARAYYGKALVEFSKKNYSTAFDLFKKSCTLGFRAPKAFAYYYDELKLQKSSLLNQYGELLSLCR